MNVHRIKRFALSGALAGVIATGYAALPASAATTSAAYVGGTYAVRPVDRDDHWRDEQDARRRREEEEARLRWEREHRVLDQRFTRDDHWWDRHRDWDRDHDLDRR